MDVSQLASSLLALGKLIESTDAIVSGEPNRIRVKVQSDVRRGSFDVGIVVALDSAWDAAKAWVMSPEGMATGTVLSLLGLDAVTGAKGLIEVVRWAKGRKIARKTTLRDGNTELELEDGETTVVTPAVARIADDPQVRVPLEKFTQPLRDDGVEAIRFETEAGRVTEKIEAREAEDFEATAGADPTSTSRFQATYQIKRLHFETGKKWRLSSGSQTIFATIEDGQFWERVGRSEEAFTAGDYLVCDMRMDQWLGPSGLKTEYAVERSGPYPATEAAPDAVGQRRLRLRGLVACEVSKLAPPANS
jgi:hypothetical protein